MRYALEPVGRLARSPASGCPSRAAAIAVGVALVMAASRVLAWSTAIDGLSHGTDSALSVAVDASGDVAATGYTTDGLPGPFNGSFPVVKLDGSTGAVAWRRDVAGNNAGFGDQGNKVLVDQSGDVLVAGRTTNDVTFFDFTVAKLAGGTGDVIWRNDVNGTAQGGYLSYDQARDLAIDANGDVVAAGGLMETGTFIASDFAVVKLAGATGAELWRATINGTSTEEVEDYANAVAVDAAGNAIATGVVFGDPGYDPNFTIAKFAAADGALVWRRDLHDAYNDYPYDVAVDAAGDAVAVGQLGFHGVAVKVAGGDGAVVWQRPLGGTASAASEVYGVAIDAAGDAYVVGWAYDVYSGDDLVVWKLAAGDGHEIWRRAVTSAGSWAGARDSGYGIALDGAGSVAVGGAIGGDVAVLRLRASDGAELMRHMVPPSTTGYGSVGAVAFTPTGDVVGAGSFDDEATGTDQDFFVTKVPGAGPVEGCGNGIVEGVEWCDDGNDSSTDACLPACLPNSCVDGVAVTEAKIKIRRGVAKLQGIVAFGSGGVPGGFAPSIRGAQLLLETPGDSGRVRYVDLTAAAHPIPASAAGACGAGDGWLVSDARQTYWNRSGAIDPPTCTPGSAAGLLSLRFDDRSSRGRGVRVKADIRGLTTLPNGPMRVTIALGGSAADTNAGVCGIVAYPLPRCRGTETSYRCK